MRLSANRLRIWQECSLKAFFNYNLELPRIQNSKASFGTCIHAALALYNETQNVELALDRFKYWWQNPAVLGVEPQVWSKFTSYGELRKRGIEIIKAYHDSLKWETREVIAVEHKFLVPFGKHELTGCVDLVEARTSGKGKNLLRIVDLKTNSKQPNIAELRLDLQFCVDETTEILTRRGWKTYLDLAEGEDVLTLDQDADVAEWQPLDAINVFPVHEQSLISMEGKGHSSLTTKNHRWPVERVSSSKKRGWWRDKRTVTTENLSTRDRILCAAPVVNLPTTPKYDDYFVELVAWYWTEGEYLKGGQGAISQSEMQNPQKVAQIRTCLEAVIGPRSETMRSGGVPGPPRWREFNENGTIRFYLNKASAALLRNVCIGKEKVVLEEFIASLTLSQLLLFIHVSIEADGHDRAGCRVITQSVKARLDLFQMACSLAGVRSTLTKYYVGGEGRYAGREQWRLALKDKQPFFCPIPHPRGFTVSEVVHTGYVWCPTTQNSTWLARRNGQVYFTGNTTYTYASLQPEFWMGNGPDFPGIPDGEKLYERFDGMSRRAIWHHLWTMKEIDAGPRVDDDFMRMYRLADQIGKAEEAGIAIPNIGTACIYCSFHEQCGLKIPTKEEMAREEDAWI